jgi:hypothetical protein
VIDGILFAVILGIMMFYFVGTFIESWNETEREEMERKARAKYGKEARYWKEQALMSRTEIKVICGGTKEFTIENRR